MPFFGRRYNKKAWLSTDEDAVTHPDPLPEIQGAPEVLKAPTVL